MRIGDTIYLDHQATTPVDPRVDRAMQPYHSEIFGNPHSTDHILGIEAAKAIEIAATSIADILGADADEIIFTSGATEANNLGMLGLAMGMIEGNRKRVLISAVEHKSVLATASVLQKRLGFTVETIPVGSDGVINLTALEATISNDVLFTSIMLVNNEIGSIQPIQKIHCLCEAQGIVLHCDATQAVGMIDLSEISSYTDLLSISGHKIYGPKGIGALLASRQLHQYIEPIIHGGGQQGHLRSGTLPTALCVGMGVAAEIASEIVLQGENEEAIRQSALRDHFVTRIMELDGQISLNGPALEARHPGNANLCFGGFLAQDILAMLQPHLAASTGSACTTGIPEVSHVLNAIGLSDVAANASVRFSLGRQTTLRDVNEAVDLIDATLTKLHRFSNN